MKQMEVINGVINYAQARMHEDTKAENICHTVVICGESVKETLSYCTKDNEFIKGAIFGKVAFFVQIALAMFYHFNDYKATTSFDVSPVKLLEEQGVM